MGPRMCTLRRTTIFMLRKGTPQWHALDLDRREQVLDDALVRVFNGFPLVSLRLCDTEGFATRCSLVALWKAEDPAGRSTRSAGRAARRGLKRFRPRAASESAGRAAPRAARGTRPARAAHA